MEGRRQGEREGDRMREVCREEGKRSEGSEGG